MASDSTDLKDKPKQEPSAQEKKVKAPPDRPLSQIEHKRVKLFQPTADSDPDASGISELYSATLQLDDDKKTTVPVLVKQFFEKASQDYQQERDGTALILDKTGMDAHFVKVYGCNDEKRWIIMEVTDCSLKQALEEARASGRPLDNALVFRVLYDVARALDTMASPIPKTETDKESGDQYTRKGTIIMHRDIKASNIRLRKGWAQLHKETKWGDLDKLPIIAKLGDAGCVTTRSKSNKSGSKGDLFRLPPDAVDNGSNYDERVDIWRFGILAFETWAQMPWDKYTDGDRERVIIKRLKPKENKELQDIYNDKWIAQPDQGGAPAPLYEVVQVGCWQLICARRPPASAVAKVMRWVLEDELIAQKVVQPRDSKLPKSQDAELVIEHCGFKLFPVPSGGNPLNFLPSAKKASTVASPPGGMFGSNNPSQSDPGQGAKPSQGSNYPGAPGGSNTNTNNSAAQSLPAQTKKK